MHPSQIERYEIRGVIGVGGMGTVYRAFDPRTRQEVALKVPNVSPQAGEDVRKRAERELEVMLSLRNHPGIVTVFDFTSEPFGIVMELLEGETLYERLQRYPEGLPIEQALGIIRDICGAVDYAHHSDVLHRDLKPGNVILTQLGSQEAVKVMDFGLAALLRGSEPRMTKEGLVMGTPAYMAPEQCLNDALGAYTDIYAIGLMLYELLTGRPPFEADSEFALMQAQVQDPIPQATAIRPEVPPRVEAVIHRATQKEPGERYERCETMIADLEAALLELKTGTPAPTPVVSGTPESTPALAPTAAQPSPAARGKQLRERALAAAKHAGKRVGIVSAPWRAAVRSNPRPFGIGGAALLLIFVFVLWPRAKDPEAAAPVEVAELGAMCGPCELDRWIEVEGELVCSGETPCGHALEHTLTACDAITTCVEGQLCQRGYCIDERSPMVAPALPDPEAPQTAWLNGAWPSVVALPRVSTVEGSAGYGRLREAPDAFDGPRGERLANGSKLLVLESACAADGGRWARVQVLDTPPGERRDDVGSEGWIRRQELLPHGNGCCGDREFDCGWSSEAEGQVYFEAPVAPSTVRAANDINLRTSPVYNVRIDNQLAQVQARRDVTIEREACTATGYRWAWVTSGPPEAPVSGWAHRLYLGGESPVCCLGRELVDPECVP